MQYNDADAVKLVVSYITGSVVISLRCWNARDSCAIIVSINRHLVGIIPNSFEVVACVVQYQ